MIRYLGQNKDLHFLINDFTISVPFVKYYLKRINDIKSHAPFELSNTEIPLIPQSLQTGGRVITKTPTQNYYIRTPILPYIKTQNTKQEFIPNGKSPKIHT